MVQLGPRATCANAPLSEVIANLVRSAARGYSTFAEADAAGAVSQSATRDPPLAVFRRAPCLLIRNTASPSKLELSKVVRNALKRRGPQIQSLLPNRPSTTCLAVSPMTRPAPLSPLAIADIKERASLNVTCGGSGATSGSVFTSRTTGRSLESASCHADARRPGESTKIPLSPSSSPNLQRQSRGYPAKPRILGFPP